MIDTEKKSERLNMVLSPSEIEAIDEWRFSHRIGSRSEAIRQLIALGLSSSDKDELLDRCRELLLSLPTAGFSVEELNELEYLGKRLSNY